MTKKSKKTVSQKTRAGSHKAKCKPPIAWHITDFDDIFKMADDLRKGRKGPLAYTKSFVSLSGTSKPCETHHYERLKDLKSRPDRHLLRSVFEDLKNWAAHKTQSYQGYLVTHAGRPADYDYISAQIDHIDKEELKKAMMILSRIGLIERVALNGQFLDEKAEPPDDSGNETDNSGNDAQSLKKAEGKSQAAPEEDVSEDKTTHGLTAVEGEEKENDNSAKHKAKSQDKGRPQGQVEDEPPSSPSAAPPLPLEPQVSDDLGGSQVIPFPAPQTSISPAGGPQGGPFGLSAAGYDRSDVIFGGRVYAAIGLRWSAESPEGQREIRSFASKWSQARASLAGLPPEVVDELGVRLISEARKISRRGKRNKRPGAVWCTVADKLVGAKLREDAEVRCG